MRVSTHIRNTLTLVFALLAGGAQIAFSESQNSLCVMAESALKEASRLRGLPPRGAVPCLVRSKAQVESFLRETIASKFPPQKLEKEQLVLRAVGLVPDDYDYVNGIIAAYVSQIGGYYDPDRKHFVMVDSIRTSLQRVVAVHELTHALQDQYFDLNRFLAPTIENGDELMAHAAVSEGDANLVMREAIREQPDSSPKEVGAVEDPGATSSAAIPEELQEILLFPYEYGQKFVEEVSARGGKVQREAIFRHPPRSTREILHPEEYLQKNFRPDNPTVAEVVGEKVGARAGLYTDTLGEFGVSVLLSPKVAQGWRGDLVVASPAVEDTTEVVWLTRWDTESDAQKFMESYAEMLTKRYRSSVRSEWTELSNKKRVLLRRNGRDVRIEFRVRP